MKDVEKTKKSTSSAKFQIMNGRTCYVQKKILSLLCSKMIDISAPFSPLVLKSVFFVGYKKSGTIFNGGAEAMGASIN